MIDKYGLIVQDNGDGGDCPCRCGVVIGYEYYKKNTQAPSLVSITQECLTSSQNTYWRYPTQYNQPNDFSRDQASRLMLGYAMAKRPDLVDGYYHKLVENDCRHPNGDFIGTGEPGNIIRGLGWWAFYPLLVILDLKFLVDIISYKWQSWDIDNLFIMDLYYANKKYWTPTAWLAAKLYDKTAAAFRVMNNLGSPIGNNGCKEALEANLWFLKQL